MPRFLILITSVLLTQTTAAQVPNWQYNQLVGEYNDLLRERDNIAYKCNELRDDYNILVEEANRESQALYSTVCEHKDTVTKQLRVILNEYYRQLPEYNHVFSDNARLFNYESYDTLKKAFITLRTLSVDQDTCNENGVNRELNKKRHNNLHDKLEKIDRWIDQMKNAKDG
ncbi:hypothetical protein LJ739_11525 [Aestuariibacter halophilus]|uniref:Uncharacterized protein n=1 Tax=Fluctibacter halophilus TaxID=226011 RepID=A0ABS8G8M1_9ALTE|nr:hypothetical protein [Aestuariibacter halophilus]MCC2616873.1 hypothetical protein [Aestuariibacter halophilus]